MTISLEPVDRSRENGERPVRWALVGASTIARTYMASAIRKAPGGELAGIASGSEERARELGAEFQIPQIFPSVSDLWEADTIDAVYISSVNSLHASQTLSAAAAHKHVLCDKPLAVSSDDAKTMIRACEDAGVVLGVNHNLRCAPAHLAVRELIQEGRLGELLAARVFHGSLLPPHLRRWRTRDADSGGGAALDVTVHDADLLRFLLSDEVIDVTAFSAAQGPETEGVEDAIAGVMSFSRGLLATFQDSFSLPFSKTALTIHGDAGWLEVVDAMADDPIAVVRVTDAAGCEELSLPRDRNLYEGVVAAFNQAVHGGGSPAATGDDGLRAVEIATAARESASLRRAINIRRSSEVV